MIGTKRSWTGRAAVVAMAAGLMWATSSAIAAPAVEVVDTAVIVPSANSLLRFYPSQLSSTPAGVIEDKEVWLAKVQGLMAGSPSLLQQSLLMSQSKQEFSSNVNLLQQLQTGSIKQSGMNLRAQAMSGAMAAKALGDSTNLEFHELEPCRIMDTRHASGASGVQGPVVGNHLYNIPGYITAGGNWSTYGQTAPLSDCGLNSTYGGSINAVAIVITILNPNFDAFLGVGDTNNLATTLSTVALNYTHGQGLSTLYVVPQGSNTIYFAMPTGLSAQIIFDVVGFFHVSDATALQCQYPVGSGVGTGNFANNSLLTLFLPGCASGFALTGAGCSTDYIGGSLMNEVSPSNFSDCIWFNNSGATLDKNAFHAESVCCRVPGR